MKTIWKFPLEITDEQTIRMPSETEILTVQTQNDTLCLWTLVSRAGYGNEDRKIMIYGTGHPIENIENLRYIGSTQMRDGSLVWHVFEKR